MKVLAFGDIHGDAFHAQKLAEKAKSEGVELVILCGDITQAGEGQENIVGPFKAHGLPMLLISGNHESFETADFLAELYDCTHLHGKGVEYNKIGFFGCGGANIGMHRISEEEIYQQLEHAHSQLEEVQKKIMVTHVHPSETMMENFSQFFPGSKGLRKAVESFKPDILFCSHVHEAAGLEEKIGGTRVINVGKEGKILDL